uniref:Thoc2 domain-containing protein n=1 Tax=Macrostomum lignano TaxID=282301 RepID=A0A1I8JQY3_9PLAT
NCLLSCKPEKFAILNMPLQFESGLKLVTHCFRASQSDSAVWRPPLMQQFRAASSSSTQPSDNLSTAIDLDAAEFPAQRLLLRQTGIQPGWPRYVMKRLTKDNVKQQGRQLGKLSHSNPGPLFEVVIEQITRYDNLVTPVVDSFRYLNSLGLDVLAYCIIEALADSSEESPRLLTLSTFVGAMCKKYTFDLAGCFQYALNQLKNKRAPTAAVSEEVTEEQLEAMLGGELLRVEGGYFSQTHPKSSRCANTKKSSSRLKELLMEHGLVLPFVFLLAQQRDCVVFNGEPTERHVKQCGRLYDNCQDVLIQFGIFLSLQLSTDEFVAQCPSIDQLINVYHKAQPRTLNLWTRLEITSFVDASVEVTREVSEKVRGLYPKKVWDDLNIEFFVTFWTLQCWRFWRCLKRPTSGRGRRLKLSSNRALTDRLTEEERAAGHPRVRVRARIAKDKDLGSTKTDTVTTFLQFCVFPAVQRIPVHSAQDAVVLGSKFMHILHDLQRPRQVFDSDLLRSVQHSVQKECVERYARLVRGRISLSYENYRTCCGTSGTTERRVEKLRQVERRAQGPGGHGDQLRWAWLRSGKTEWVPEEAFHKK